MFKKVRYYLSRSFLNLVYYTGAIRIIKFLVNRFRLTGSKESRLSIPYITKRERNNIQIYFYHRVNNEQDPFFPGVPNGVFKKQIEYLYENCKILPLDEAVHRLKAGEIPDNAIAITFDDGYKDNYQNAFPILKQYSIPATIFLATGFLETGKPLWHDRVFSAFRRTKVQHLYGFKNDGRNFSLRNTDEKRKALTRIIHVLKYEGESERESTIEELMTRLEVHDTRETKDRMLAWDEIVEMSKSGISFGSHTVNHPILSRLTVDNIREEMFKSKHEIECQLGISIDTFAYPNGKMDDFNEVVKTVVKEAGYLCAVTTIYGANPYGQDPFELRRMGAWEDRLPEFAWNLNHQKFLC